MSVAVQHCLDGLFLFFGKCPIATEQHVFFQTLLPFGSRKSGTVGAAHKVVDGDMKIVGDPGKSGDIRFDIVVFIFIDGLLTDPDGFGQSFLRNSSGRTKKLP